MTSESHPKGVVAGESRDESGEDFSELHMRPAEEVLLALAREVLKRLASQYKEHSALPNDVTQLADALIAKDAKTATRLIEDRIKDGVAFNEIYLEYLGPAAALLGKRWESDEVTFADVTVGTGRVYAIMRSVNRRAKPNRPPEKRSAVFAMVPGDDHVLGLKMAVDLARKRGWDIEAHLDTDHDDLVNAVKDSGALLVGLSAGGIHSLPNLARIVLALRMHAPNAKILVSGGIAELDRENVDLLHVDAIAAPFDDAMAKLDALWDSFHLPDEK